MDRCPETVDVARASADVSPPDGAGLRWDDLAGDRRFETPLKRLGELDANGLARLREGVDSRAILSGEQFSTALNNALVNWSPNESLYSVRPGTGEYMKGPSGADLIYLTKGGEHLVFRDGETIFKLDYNANKRVLGWTEGWEPGRLSGAEATSALLDIANDKESRFAKLRDSHGPSHVIDQTVDVRIVDWPGRVINEFIGENKLDGDRTYEFPTIVTRQSRVHGLESLDNLDLATGYAEIGKNPNPEKYVEVNRRWLELVGPADFDRELLLDVQQSPSIARLLQRSQRNPAFMDALRRFASSSLAYTAATGETMDMVGDGNVVFIDSRSYLLVDALHPYPARPLWKATEVLHRLNRQEELTRQDQVGLVNVLNYVRTVNALAHATGLQERISIVPRDFHSDRWKRFLELWRK
ncbi:hypothetical protein ACFQX6_03355 [Streptosporangium lutulentum]